MASGIPFADYIAKANLDLASLRGDLNKGVKIVEDGALKMQNKLDQVGFGANRAGSGVRNLSGRLSGLGQVATVADSRLGGFIGALGGAASGLGVLLAGINPVIAAVALLAATVAAFRGPLAKWVVGLTEVGKAAETAERALTSMESRLKSITENQAQDRPLAALRDQIAFERGEITGEELQRRSIERAFAGGGFGAGRAAELQAELDALKAQRQEREKSEAAEIAISNQISARKAAMREEFALMTGRLTQADLILDKEERELFIRNQIVRSLKDQEATEKNLARQFAIESGLNKPSDFASTGLELGLLRAREARDSALEQAQQADRLGFGIKLRDSSAFRFQGAGSGDILIGEQRNEARDQTSLLRSIDNEFKTQVRRLIDAFLGPGGLQTNAGGLRR